MEYGKAFFLSKPRTIDELYQPHMLSDERPYAVEKVICLNKTDYENFTSDMLADRQFLEDNALLQDSKSQILHCLLVKQKNTDTGILVVPDGAWVALAALHTVN